jgi:pimeloyl-ACP methyl ester carboxylesterase
MLIVSMAAGCAAEASELEDVGRSEAELGSFPLPSPTLLARLAAPHRLTPAQLDEVHRLEHDVYVGPGRRVRVTETFTLRSWLRAPRRAMLLLPGTVSVGSFYDLDVDGYRFASTLAQRGFFVFAVDYEGSGDSTYPPNGLDVTHSFLVEANRKVLRYVRLARAIPKVDVLGESNGGAIAAELCADRARTRSCVLSSMIYREGTPFFQAVFLDPGFLGFLASQPNGYIPVGPELYFNITSRTSPEVTAAILATQPGVYAVAPLLAPTTLPWFDPTRARVPALILQGTEDNIGAQIDSDLLAADYGSARGAGGVATIVRIPGAGHIPRIEPAPVNEQWTQAVLGFVDP